MKAIQNSHKSKTNIIYNLEHYILYIVHFVTHFFTYFFLLLRRFVSNLRNKVLGLYSFKTLWRRSGTFSSVVLLILCGLVIVPIYNKVNEVEAATNEQTAPTLTVNVTNDTASLDLVVRDDSGTFASSSTSGSNATFTVATNNFTGYTLSIKSSSSNTNLTNTSTNPNSILETISSSMDSNTFDDENYNGKWGYLPSKYNSNANTTIYYPSPTIAGVTLDKTSAANTTANSYTIAIGARADCYSTSSSSGNASADYDVCPKGWRMPTGASSGEYQTLYTAYSSNATNYVTALRTSLPGGFNGSAQFSVDSYGYFWSSTRYDNYNMHVLQTYTARVYPETYVDRVYGFSVRCVKTNDGYMQDVTSAQISAMSDGDTLTLADNRDNTTYVVGKLSDGNLWMLDNLALNPTVTTLTPENTNVTSTVTKSFVNKTSSWTTGNSSGGLTNPWFNISLAGDSNTNIYAAGASGSGKVGAYYSYCAASAGTYCHAYNSGNSAGATQDICPANWRMPTSGSGGEYEILRNKYNDAKAFTEAFRLPLSGYFYNNSAAARGSAGVWWSSTYYSGNTAKMYSLYAYSSVDPNNTSNRYDGLPMRCVADPPKYMQTYDVAANLANIGSSTTLIDERDGQEYTVARLADNKIWMTQELRVGSSTKMTADDTNISTEQYNNGAYYSLSSTSNNASSWGTSTYTDEKVYMYGNIGYYNFCAASAGTVCSSSSQEDAVHDICPAGWRLPTSSNMDSDNTYSVSPINLKLTGFFDRSYDNNRRWDGVGHYWSSVSSSGTNALSLYFYSDGVFTSNGGSKAYGYPIRCTLKG